MLGISYMSLVISLFVYSIPTIVTYYGGVMTTFESRRYMFAGTFFLAITTFLALVNFFKTYPDTHKRKEN